MARPFCMSQCGGSGSKSNSDAQPRLSIALITATNTERDRDRSTHRSTHTQAHTQVHTLKHTLTHTHSLHSDSVSLRAPASAGTATKQRSTNGQRKENMSICWARVEEERGKRGVQSERSLHPWRCTSAWLAHTLHQQQHPLSMPKFFTIFWRHFAMFHEINKKKKKKNKNKKSSGNFLLQFSLSILPLTSRKL